MNEDAQETIDHALQYFWTVDPKFTAEYEVLWENLATQATALNLLTDELVADSSKLPGEPCLMSITATETGEGESAPEEWIFEQTATTIEDIVDHLINVDLDADGRHAIRMMKRKDLIRLHHGLGTMIRNSFQLWHGSHPLCQNGEHPDDVSFEIIKELHRKLQHVS